VTFVHRQVLQIPALQMFLQEVLFAYGAVEKPVGGGYIPSRLIKVLVPDKEEYEILADLLRKERAKRHKRVRCNSDTHASESYYRSYIYTCLYIYIYTYTADTSGVNRLASQICHNLFSTRNFNKTFCT
jgi:hypothetical protein